MSRNHKSKPGKNQPDSGADALFLFLAGCAAEWYVLILRRYYYSGTLLQMLAWADLLPVLGTVGLVIAVISLVIFIILRKKRFYADNAAGHMWKKWLRLLLCFFLMESVFLAAASFLTRWNMSAVLLFSVLVPMATALGVLWLLYDRECALSLTMLGTAAFVAWLRCRGPGYASLIQIFAAFCLLILAGIAYLLYAGKLSKLLSANINAFLIYISCALSAIGLLCALFSPAAAYTALIGLAMIIFGLVVYYTVKQL